MWLMVGFTDNFISSKGTYRTHTVIAYCYIKIIFEASMCVGVYETVWACVYSDQTWDSV